MATKPIKVTRTTGRYNYGCYNLKVQKTPPSEKMGWTIFDAVRNMEQVKMAITSQPPGTAVVVASKNDSEFPYYIYTNESLLRKRREEYKNGVRWT